jgi:hypothetical protein
VLGTQVGRRSRHVRESEMRGRGARSFRRALSKNLEEKLGGGEGLGGESIECGRGLDNKWDKTQSVSRLKTSLGVGQLSCFRR